MRIRRLPTAVVDIDGIWEYVNDRNPAAADRLVNRITDATARLENYPESGPRREDIAPTARSIVVGSYTVLYRVTEASVEIVRVVHGARDMRAFAEDFA